MGLYISFFKKGKKLLKKILRFLLVFLSAFAVVFYLPSTTAFADSYSISVTSANTNIFFDNCPGEDYFKFYRPYSSSATSRFYIYVNGLHSGDVVKFSFLGTSSVFSSPGYAYYSDFSIVGSWQTSYISINTSTWNDNLSLTVSSFDQVAFRSSSSNVSWGSDSYVYFKVYVNDVLITEASDLSSSYQDGYDDGYSAGVRSVDTQSFYDSGYSAGVRSVDTQSYYNQGYSDGYTAGVQSGGSGGDTISDLVDMGNFVPISYFYANSNYSSGLTPGYFIDTSYLGNVWSAQEIYDITHTINGIGHATSSFRRTQLLCNDYVLFSGSPLLLSGFTVPAGHRLVISFIPKFAQLFGVGQSGSFPVVNNDGSSAGNLGYSSYTLNLSTVDTTPIKLRLFGGDSTNNIFQEFTSFISSGGRYWVITDPIDVSTSRLDIEFTSSDSNSYILWFGYIENDYAGSLYDILTNGDDSTGNIVSGANSRLDQFNSGASTINSFENQMINDFNSSVNGINSSVNGFHFTDDIITGAGWVANQMQRTYDYSSGFQIFYIYPILLGIALVFIGGGIGKKYK